MISQPSVAYVIDPRFPGGTSSAVASELAATSRMARVHVHAITSKMFKNRGVAPQLEQALDELGLSLIWDAELISADIVIWHNPSFLKFQKSLNSRIVARHLIVVTHENFLRPGQVEGFDVHQCLEQIDRASLALRKSIAPISPHNRATVRDWMQADNRLARWSVLPQDWFNICEFEMLRPAPDPSDRRGRHSRPGFEKFPGLPDMDACFPRHARANVILGADTFLGERLHRPHWQMLPFRSIEVDQFFQMIDFVVYFTSPTWRESFGRVLAEAVAAGKLVISDPETASVFGGAVIGAAPRDVDQIIKRHIQQPGEFRSHVTGAQKKLRAFSATS
ncbi:MAG: hypothetical protein ACC646_04645, partial [Paracoccaceae bacterium]